MLDKVRIDKWLWSVRIYKTRTMASNAVRAGKVRINEVPVKASYQLQRGERIVILKSGFNFQIEVVELIQKRVGAPLAQKCYTDHTPQEELTKYKDWFVGKTNTERRARGAGRPTKKERREIEDFKINQFEDWGDED